MYWRGGRLELGAPVPSSVLQEDVIGLESGIGFEFANSRPIHAGREKKLAGGGL